MFMEEFKILTLSAEVLHVSPDPILAIVAIRWFASVVDLCVPPCRRGHRCSLLYNLCSPTVIVKLATYEILSVLALLSRLIHVSSYRMRRDI